MRTGTRMNARAHSTGGRMRDFFAVALVAAMWLLLIWTALSVPVVEWSWTAKECVRVIPPEAGTCDQLPKRYERVWVR